MLDMLSSVSQEAEYANLLSSVDLSSIRFKLMDTEEGKGWDLEKTLSV